MTKDEVVALLKIDLSRELTAMCFYMLYGAMFKGFGRHVYRDFYEREAKEERRHAAYLAMKIVSIGGTLDIPSISLPKRIPVSNKEILMIALKMEDLAISSYEERLTQVGFDKGLKDQIDLILSQELSSRKELSDIISVVQD